MMPEQADSVIDVLTRARETILELAAQNIELRCEINRLVAELSEYKQAIVLHKRHLEEQCDGGARCGYTPRLQRSGRRCSTCPLGYTVDVMPSRGAA